MAADRSRTLTCVRLFVAIDLPRVLKDGLEAAVELLRPALPTAKWTRPEGRHLTLKFLGEVAEERLGEIEAALDLASAHRPPFGAALGEIGGFPNLRRPRILWVGTTSGVRELQALAREVEACLQPLGFKPEGRPFSGHLTLARFPSPSPVGALPDVGIPHEPFDVEEIVLFQSQLGRGGARYTSVRRYPLSG